VTVSIRKLWVLDVKPTLFLDKYQLIGFQGRSASATCLLRECEKNQVDAFVVLRLDNTENLRVIKSFRVLSLSLRLRLILRLSHSQETYRDFLRLFYYGIARGSAVECAAICDVLVLIELRLKQSATSAKQLLEQITRILTTICSKN